MARRHSTGWLSPISTVASPASARVGSRPGTAFHWLRSISSASSLRIVISSVVLEMSVGDPSGYIKNNDTNRLYTIYSIDQSSQCLRAERPFVGLQSEWMPGRHRSRRHLDEQLLAYGVASSETSTETKQSCLPGA